MRSYIIIKFALTKLLFITLSALALNCTAASYVLVDSNGQPTTTDARCVTADSGLTWELKTDDGGPHDKDNIYRWGGIGTKQTGDKQTGAEQTGKIFFDDWNSLVNTTNNEKLCGFDDWRVPTIDELKTLIVTNRQNPAIDSVIFRLTLAVPYWSTSTYANYPEHAQTVDFATGASNYYNGFRGDRLPVRLVRTNKPRPAEQ